MASLIDDKLEKFFTPKTIAVIGASRKKEKIGNKIVANLLANKSIVVFPINPKAKSIYKLKSYPNVLSVKENIDLAVIAVPSSFVKETVLECANKNIKHIIVISAGFSETGTIGRHLEEEIKKIAQKFHLSLLGPNCLGIISGTNNLNISFGQNVKPGNVTFISQSGALGVAILDWAKERNFGFANFISLGNKAVLSENDFLEYFSNQEVPIIAIYLESLADGAAFLKLTRKLSFKTPVIVLKGGQEKETKIAVTSHTGAMAGSFEAVRAALRQANCIEAENLEEFFSLLEIFSSTKKIKGKQIALLTNGGGPGILTLDVLVQTGNKLAVLSGETKTALKNYLPPEASLANPIDLLGDATPQRYQRSLKIILDDPKTDIVYVLLTPQEVTNVPEIAKAIVESSKNSSKMVIASFMGGEKVLEGKKILREGNVIHFPFPEQALKALAKIFVYYAKRREGKKGNLPVRKGKKNLLVSKAILEKRQKLYEEEAFSSIGRYGIAYPPIEKVNNLAELRTKLKKLRFPIALKLDAPEVFHRTRENAIFLNLETVREAEVAFNKLRQRVGSIYCQQMIDEGIEVIIGAKKDPDFGHLIMFGSGGIYAEYLKDTAYAVTPMTQADARDLIKATKIGKRLAKSMTSLKRIITSLSRVLEENPAISELDINPLIINEKGIFAVDVKIQVRLEE